MKYYTTLEMVAELFKNPNKKFSRVGDKVFKVSMTTRGYIVQTVHDFSMEMPIGLYIHEIWVEDTEECEE